MIYAINKRTKEHRRFYGSAAMAMDTYADTEFEVLLADDDGWIEWHGGDCPLPGDCFVQIKTNIGIKNEGSADEFRWAKQSRHGDIIAYRPILAAKTETPAWDGEGLPPAGCECYLTHPGVHGWHRAHILAYYNTAWADSGEAAIVKCHSMFANYPDGVSVLNIDDALKFRPIRSEEDRLTEEAMELIGVESDEYGAESVVYRMIKAGYRKTGGE